MTDMHAFEDDTTEEEIASPSVVDHILRNVVKPTKSHPDAVRDANGNVRCGVCFEPATRSLMTTWGNVVDLCPWCGPTTP